MKTILLCMCILFVAVGTLSLNGVATSSASPTNAPAQETIVTPNGGYPTEAPYITPIFYVTQEYSYPPPIEPYPVPEAQTLEDFTRLLISIFGINHNGKNVQHK